MTYIMSKMKIIVDKLKNVGIELRKERAIFEALDSKAPLVSYIGWTGHNNLGDEILYEAHQALFPRLRFVPYRPYSAALIYSRFKRRRLYAAGFLGGGTLINQSPVWLRKIKHLQRQGLPMYCFGTGVTENKFRDQSEKTDIKEWSSVLNTFEFVGLRGPRSARLLIEAGCNKVSLVGDTALALAPSRYRYNKPSKIIGFNYGLVKENKIWGDTLAYTKNVVQIINDLIAAGYEVHLLPVWDQDIKSNQELLILVDSPACTMYTNFSSLEDYRKELSKCGVFVGQKLHATIISCLQRIPSIMIEYQPKCRDFMASINMERYTLKTSQCTPDVVMAMIQELYTNHQSIAGELNEQILGHRKLQYKLAHEIEAQLLCRASFYN